MDRVGQGHSVPQEQPRRGHWWIGPCYLDFDYSYCNEVGKRLRHHRRGRPKTGAICIVFPRQSERKPWGDQVSLKKLTNLVKTAPAARLR